MRVMSTANIMLLIIGLVLSSSPISEAHQWETLAMRPGTTLMDLCMLDDGQHGWSVGGLGSMNFILRTTDGGANWDLLELPFESFPQGIHFISDQLGWMCCDDGAIYMSTDGGSSWTEQPSGSDRTLTRVQFINADEGWVTGGRSYGSSYHVMHTVNGGASWEDQSFGSDCYSCEDLYITDSLTGWICGEDDSLKSHIHRTTDGGQTWARQNVPAGEGPVTAITFADSSNGWAASSNRYGSSTGVIYHTDNGGDDWEIQGNTNCSSNNAIDCLDAQTVVIASHQVLSSDPNRILVTEDGGDTWIDREVPLTGYSYGLQLTGGAVRMIGYHSKIMVSYDLGHNWAWETYAARWNSMTWTSDSDGWLVAGSYIGTDGLCLRTGDGGETWEPDFDAPGGTRVQFIDPFTGWMLWYGNWATVWRTTDGGVSWASHGIGSGSFTEDIFFTDADHGWASGSEGMIRATTDGGRTWNSQSSGVDVSLPIIVFTDNLEGWCAGGYGDGQGTVLHTTDGGNSWNHQTPAADHHFYTGSFLNNEEGWLVSVHGWVHHTEDGGESWELLSQVDHSYPTEIFMEDSLNGWLLTNSSEFEDDGRGYIYRTRDGGETWTLDWDSAWAWGRLNDLARTTGGSLWVCGGNSTLLRRGDGSSALIVAGPGPAPDNPSQVILVPFGGTPETDGFVFDAYHESGFGTNITCADLAGRGGGAIVTGPGPGPDSLPWVRAFTVDGRPLDNGAVDFIAYGTPRYGVNVAAGDVDGDGFDEIITGAGPGAVFGPHVRGWNYDGEALAPMGGISFMAYGTLKYGVNVAAGDVDGDGFDEILTGAGPGAVFGPHVRGWNFDDAQLDPIAPISYFAYGTLRWGVNVASGDVDGDGIDEILTGAGPGAIFGPHVRGWDYDGTAISAISGINFLAYGTNRFGVRVAGADLDGDGRDEILTAPGPGDVFGAHVRGWRYSGEDTQAIPEVNWFTFDPDEMRYGGTVAAGLF